MILRTELLTLFQHHPAKMRELRIKVTHPEHGKGNLINIYFDIGEEGHVAIIYFYIIDRITELPLNDVEKMLHLKNIDVAKLNYIQESERNRRTAEAAAEQQRIEQQRLAKQRRLQAKQELLEQEKAEEIAAQLAKEKRIEQEKIDALNVQRALMLHALYQLKKDHILNGLRTDYIATQALLAADADYMECQDLFLQQWCTTHLAQGDVKQIPDEFQRRAIGEVTTNVLLTARAGSGKTATTVNRALFLAKHCHIAPHDIMLLAFNRKAANEIRQRLFRSLYPELQADYAKEFRRQLGHKARTTEDLINAENQAINEVLEKKNKELPHVMTFHALAYAIAKPEQNIIKNEIKDESEELNDVAKKIIEEKLSDKESDFFQRVKTVMMAYFKEDWDKYIDEGGLITDKKLFNECRRSIEKKTLRGDHVKSYGEKVIANILFEHNVDYAYERNRYWSGRNYKPDFTIQRDHNDKAGIIIEFYGMQGIPTYDKQIKEKRVYWETQKKNWTLIELYPHHVAIDGVTQYEELSDKILRHLDQHGIKHKKLSDDELWEKIEKSVINDHTRTLTGFIGRCRKAQLSVKDLKEKILKFHGLNDINSTPNEPFRHSTAFHKNCYWLYREYLDTLKRENLEDFDGVLQAAINKLDQDQDRFRKHNVEGRLHTLKYLFIDEFQDFSNLFNSLIQLIFKIAPQLNVFCVGDDWQAINGFAGADLVYFEQFHQYIANSKHMYLQNNFRSTSEIVKIDNSLMRGRGHPAAAVQEGRGEVLLVKTENYQPTLIEEHIHDKDKSTPILLRLINEALTNPDCNVVLLSRNHTAKLNHTIKFNISFKENQTAKKKYHQDNFLKHLRSYFSTEDRKRITMSTTHGYKGLQSDVVIVLNTTVSGYPFIHPNWFFTSIFGDSVEKIVDAERRLFYVALTRAVSKLYIMTEDEAISPFLREIAANGFQLNNCRLEELDHVNYDQNGKYGGYIVINQTPGTSGGPTTQIIKRLEAQNFKNMYIHFACVKKTSLSEEGAYILDDALIDVLKYCDNIDIQVVTMNNKLVYHQRMKKGVMFDQRKNAHPTTDVPRMQNPSHNDPLPDIALMAGFDLPF
jgi:DNA helicase-4